MTYRRKKTRHTLNVDQTALPEAHLRKTACFYPHLSPIRAAFLRAVCCPEIPREHFPREDPREENEFLGI